MSDQTSTGYGGYQSYQSSPQPDQQQYQQQYPQSDQQQYQQPSQQQYQQQYPPQTTSYQPHENQPLVPTGTTPSTTTPSNDTFPYNLHFSNNNSTLLYSKDPRIKAGILSFFLAIGWPFVVLLSGIDKDGNNAITLITVPVVIHCLTIFLAFLLCFLSKERHLSHWIIEYPLPSATLIPTTISSPIFTYFSFLFYFFGIIVAAVIGGFYQYRWVHEFFNLFRHEEFHRSDFFLFLAIAVSYFILLLNLINSFGLLIRSRGQYDQYTRWLGRNPSYVRQEIDLSTNPINNPNFNQQNNGNNNANVNNNYNPQPQPSQDGYTIQVNQS